MKSVIPYEKVSKNMQHLAALPQTISRSQGPLFALKYITPKNQQSKINRYIAKIGYANLF